MNFYNYRRVMLDETRPAVCMFCIGLKELSGDTNLGKDLICLGKSSSLF